MKTILRTELRVMFGLTHFKETRSFFTHDSGRNKRICGNAGSFYSNKKAACNDGLILLGTYRLLLGIGYKKFLSSVYRNSQRE